MKYYSEFCIILYDTQLRAQSNGLLCEQDNEEKIDQHDYNNVGSGYILRAIFTINRKQEKICTWCHITFARVHT